MSRDHRVVSLRRKGNSTRSKSKFIVYVEGCNTETSYINLLKQQNCTVKTIYVKKGNGISSCLDFLNTSEKHFNSLSSQIKSSYTDKWLMFDYDGHEDFAQAICKARKDGFKVAFSSMCIEYWFLLHFIDHDGSAMDIVNGSHSRAQINVINQFLKKYNKSHAINIPLYDNHSKIISEDFFDLMLAFDSTTGNRRIVDAYLRAKNIHQIKQNQGNEFSESVTTVYEFLHAIGLIHQKSDGKVIYHD